MLKKISFFLLLQTFIGLLAIGQTSNYKLISFEEPNTVKEGFFDLLPITLMPLTVEKPLHSKLSSRLEFGLSGGLFLINGGIKRGNPVERLSLTNYGYSINLKFNLNNIFSLRPEFLYGMASGNADGFYPSFKGFSATWLSGTLWSLVNLNSFLAPDKEKKLSINLMFGYGANATSVLKYGSIKESSNESEISTFKFGLSDNYFHSGVGLNVSFRITSNFSIALEKQSIRAMGERADKLDGWDVIPKNTSSSKDVIGFTNLSLNYRFGKKIDYSKTNLIELLNSVINEMRFPLINEN